MRNLRVRKHSKPNRARCGVKTVISTPPSLRPVLWLAGLTLSFLAANATPSAAQDPGQIGGSLFNGASARGLAVPFSASQAVIARPAPVAPQPSPTPSSDAYTLKTSDPNLVSNGPVPDTPENRARFGGAMSMSGRHTAADGN